MNNKKTIECRKCKKQFPRNKLTFSYCYNGLLCLDCYKSQFPSIPSYPSPVFIERYKIQEK